MIKISTNDCRKALCEWMKKHKDEIPVSPNPMVTPGYETDGTDKPKAYSRTHVKTITGKKYRLYMLCGGYQPMNVHYLVVEEDNKITDITWGVLFDTKEEIRELSSKLNPEHKIKARFSTPLFISYDDKYNIEFNEQCLTRFLGII